MLLSSYRTKGDQEILASAPSGYDIVLVLSELELVASPQEDPYVPPFESGRTSGLTESLKEGRTETPGVRTFVSVLEIDPPCQSRSHSVSLGLGIHRLRLSRLDV